MRKRMFLILLILLSFLAFSETERGLKFKLKKINIDEKIGKQYVVLIGVNKYKTWTNLKNPVKDAKEIKAILKERYYVDEFIELYDENATRKGIVKLFKRLIKKTKTEDSLLIYYAGHGNLDEITETGFWIPNDAGLDDETQKNWLANIQIRGYIKKIKARHFALISDACFSGDILNPNRGKIKAIDNGYYKRSYTKRSRQVLTSGSSETVPDNSEFSTNLKYALRDNNKAYLDPLMLYNEIRSSVKKTQPLFGEITNTGHQEGANFLLFLKDDETSFEESEKESNANFNSAGTKNNNEYLALLNKGKEQENYIKSLNEAYKIVLEIDKNNYLNNSDKLKAWQKFLGDYNDEKNKYKTYALEREKHWKSSGYYDNLIKEGQDKKEYLEKLEKEYEKLKSLDFDKNIENGRKIEAWQRFLSDYKKNNAYEGYALNRIKKWQKKSIIKNYTTLEIEVKTIGELYIDGKYKAMVFPGKKKIINDIELGKRKIRVKYDSYNEEEIEIKFEKNIIEELIFSWEKGMEKELEALELDFSVRNKKVDFLEIVGVRRNSPAKRLGLKKNDVIISINDIYIKNLRDFADTLRGKSVELRIMRKGEIISKEVPRLKRHLGLDLRIRRDINLLEIQNFERESQFESFGLKKNDIILSINDELIEEEEDLVDMILDLEEDEKINIKFIRGMELIQLEIE